jgi:hypothetical protein
MTFMPMAPFVGMNCGSGVHPADPHTLFTQTESRVGQFDDHRRDSQGATTFMNALGENLSDPSEELEITADIINAVAPIVQTADPHVIKLAAMLMNVPDADLAEMRTDTAEHVAARSRAFSDSIAQDQLVVRLADAIMTQRILEAGGKALPVSDHDVHLEYSKTIEKRIDILRTLEGMLPEADLCKALYLTNPQPEWKADAAVLRRLAKKYGGKVAEVVAAGCVDVLSNPRLVVTRREPLKNAIGGV